MNREFELRIHIVDDGKDVKIESKIEGAVHPLTLVDALAETIPAALRGSKPMILYLCYLLSQGKRPDKRQLELLEIDFPGIKRPESPEEHEE